MQRAMKLQVHVGKDHLVRLPSEFPEGPAEIIAIADPSTTRELSDARRAAIGRYEGESFYMADDFDAPLPADILDAFEGANGGERDEPKS
jgi:hypothetical protein